MATPAFVLNKTVVESTRRAWHGGLGWRNETTRRLIENLYC
jgi:hypothetical protein